MSGIFYCGDNLEILTRLQLIPPESIDLIYLDPPFNSQRTYNIVYKGSRAQAEAFKDHWSWEEAAPLYMKLLDDPATPPKLRTLLQGLRDLLIEDDADLLAYLTMMAPRIFALHRVLKASGSMYLHCDPTASHYLKLILDAVFGASRLQNEVIWKRTTGHSSAKRFAPVHDVLLFYSRGNRFTWNSARAAYEKEYLDKYYRFDDGDGRLYWRADLCAAGTRNGSSGRAWKGIDPTAKGMHWKFTVEKLEELNKAGRIYWPPRGTMPQYKRYRDELKGRAVSDIWDDIDRINPVGSERVGYPTQKPVALLERIIAASSNPGDLVLDPFCGCGTTIEACERMGRRWIGIDIAVKAVEVTEGRFKKLGLELPEVEWYPPDVDAAAALAKRSGLKFEKWVRDKVRAVRRRKHDRGIDGEAYFRDSRNQLTHVLISVKSGKQLNPAMVRELRGTIERERVPIGVLVTMRKPSKEMRLEATQAGFLKESDAEGPIPRLQLVTVDRLFDDRPAIRAPGVNVTEMPAPVVPVAPEPEQLKLRLEPSRPPTKARARSESAAKARTETKAEKVHAKKLASGIARGRR